MAVTGETMDAVAGLIEQFARNADQTDRHFRDETVDLAADIAELLGVKTEDV